MDKRGMPITKEIPNEETQRVIADSKKGLNVRTHDNLDDYFNEIEVEVNAEI